MSIPNFKINHDVVETPPRPSATVLLLRDAEPGFEILMQRRSDESDTFGGAYVFPGGKVDRGDGDDDMLARIDVGDAALHGALADPDLDARAAAACYVAAARETFEEAGVLLATLPDGRRAGAADAEAAYQRLREGYSFIEVLEHFDLRLAVSALFPWSRWITPKVPTLSRKRFDSRFFLARAPADQVARHDNHESTDAVWMRPRDAVARYQAGEIFLAAAQLMSLIELAGHASAEAALAASGARWPRRIDPLPFEHEGARAVAYPGDPLHGNPVQAMPGPTRLIFRKGRFEPFEGIERLWD